MRDKGLELPNIHKLTDFLSMRQIKLGPETSRINSTDHLDNCNLCLRPCKTIKVSEQ